MDDSSELDKVTTAIRDALPELRKSYGVDSLSVFGSIVHDDAGPESDVDLLVRFEGEPPGLFKFLRLERRLSSIIDRPVDLVMESALKPRLRERILSEAVTT